LRAERVDLENISTAAVVVGIDENFEVVVEVLADVAAEFGCYYLRWLGIIAMNAEINGMVCVKNSDFSSLCSRLTFIRFPLAEIRDPLGRLPQRVVQGSVDLRNPVNADGFSYVARLCFPLRNGLTIARLMRCSSASFEARTQHHQNSQYATCLQNPAVHDPRAPAVWT